jgi:hypothetical protein
LKAGIITSESTYKMEEIWTFINVNGVKVAFRSSEGTGGKQKGPGLLSLDLEKVEIIRG